MKKITLFLCILIGQFAMAQVVHIPDQRFLNSLTGQAGVDTNGDGLIQVSEAESVTTLSVSQGSIESLEGIQSFVNLTRLYCQYNQLTSLDISNLTQLETLHAFENQLTSLILPTDSKIRFIDLRRNELTTIDVSHQFELTHFYCPENNLTELDLSGLSKIKILNCTENQLTELDVSDLTDLNDLDCHMNQITSLDFTHQTGELDVGCTVNQLVTLFTKNNNEDQSFSFGGNPTLQYICGDPGDLEDIQEVIDILEYTDCVVTSVCPLNPPGPVYSINGNVRVDIDGNGCDAGDAHIPFFLMKATRTAGEIDEIVYHSANTNGQYDLRLIGGSYTVEFQSPYTTLYSAAPSSFTADVDADTPSVTQDICLTPNGSFNDLQVTVIPVEQARPGFDANYQIVYTNVGTTTLSGDVRFNYEEDVVDFVSASVSPDSQNAGELSWTFTNLTPFESKTIEVTLNLNAPTETPALNGGDTLLYDAEITPLNADETPHDNNFSLKQTVVNSFDPNDKTCLEGNVITPDLVGEYVHYLIRFENTGSASAINVVIKDVIDTSKFDMTSFVPMNASHDFVTRIENDNEVEFIFENINLPFDDANNDGFVLFKIKTLSSLVVGDTFENSAEIYFDFNFPIITNVEQTTIDVTASTDGFALNSNLKVFPNPAEEKLYIESDLVFDSVVIYDLTGKEIQRIVSTEERSLQEIDVVHLKSGIYYLSIHSGNAKTTRKFLKK